MGNAGQLQEFIACNPSVPRDALFGDTLDRTSYKNLTLPLISELDSELTKNAAGRLTAPQGLGVKDWWNYFRSAIKLSPIDRETQTLGQLPEGVLQLGSTFLLLNDDIIYQWNDKLPGDTPDLQEVLDIARNADTTL